MFRYRPGGRNEAGHRLRVVFFLCLASVAFAPAAAQAPSVTLREARFGVEIAATPQELERGLMFRSELPQDRGMLFVFPRPQQVRFWMKNTRIPLDILYFDADRRLLQVHAQVPPCGADPCQQYPSVGLVRYVLELNAGTAERIGARPGDRLEITP